MQEHITQAEADIIAPLASVFATWGYRAGPNNTHMAFEEDSHHPDIIWIQPFTDIIFRNMKQFQIGGASNLYYSSDFLDKVENIIEQPRSVVTYKGMKFLQQFLSLPGVTLAFNTLSQAPVTPTNSKMFVTLVFAAEAIKELAGGRYDKAKLTMQMLDSVVKGRIKLD